MPPWMRPPPTVARAALAAGAVGCAAGIPANTRIGPAARVTDLPVVAVMRLQHPSLAYLRSRSLTAGLAGELAARNEEVQVVSPDEAAGRRGLSGLLRDRAGFVIACRASCIVNRGTVNEAGPSLLNPLGPLASPGRVSLLHRRLSELPDRLPALRPR